MDYNQIIANLINTTFVLIIIQLIKTYIPFIRQSVPWLLPILAGAIGPAIALLQNYLSQYLVFSIDLSPIIAIFTGATATAIHQVKVQIKGLKTQNNTQINLPEIEKKN